MSIEPDKVARLKEEIKKEFPNYEIVYKTKGERWHENWEIRLLQSLVNFIGFFSPSFWHKFHEEIGNAFDGFILLPGEDGWKDWTNHGVYSVVRHEFVHMRDYKKNPVWFFLTYFLFPLPFLVSGRAYWEMRAYTQQMIVEYEQRGRVTDRMADWVKGHFKSSMYLWMFPFESVVDRKVEKLREKIENEEIEGMYPDINLLCED